MFLGSTYFQERITLKSEFVTYGQELSFSFFQHHPDPDRQVHPGEGFLDELNPLIQGVVPGNDIRGVSGHEQAFEAGIEN